MARKRTIRVTRPARLGFVALVFIILASVGTYIGVKFVRGPGGYQMGVHFPSAAGVGPGAQVYLSGVTIGTVNRIQILPDASVDIILSIFSDTDIPKDARFAVQTSVTGSPSVAITVPGRRVAQNQVPVPVPPADLLPKRILPVSQQPVGVVPLTLEAVMGQARSLGDRAYSMLSLARPYGKRLAYHLQSTRANAGATAQDLRTVPSALMGTIQSTIAKAKAHAREAQTALRERDQPKMAAIAASMQQTTSEMNQAADSLGSLERNPQIHENVRAASSQLRAVTANLAKLTRDMQMLTGSPQTKAELRDAGARLRRILQKL